MYKQCYSIVSFGWRLGFESIETGLLDCISRTKTFISSLEEKNKINQIRCGFMLICLWLFILDVKVTQDRNFSIHTD